MGKRHPALKPTLLAIGTVALCAQGVIYSLHIGQVLSREDTRNLAREWLVDHLPPRTKIVVEPVVPTGDHLRGFQHGVPDALSRQTASIHAPAQTDFRIGRRRSGVPTAFVSGPSI